MNERELADTLVNHLAEMAYLADDEPEMDAPLELIDGETGIDRVDSFETVGMMAGNPGLVIKMRDGAEFQLQIVRSR